MATTRKTGTSKSKTTTKATSRSTTRAKSAAKTATRRTSAKTAAAKSTAKSAAPAAKPVKGVTLSESAASGAAAPAARAAFTKKELLTRVRKSSGAKGRDVRAIVDAALAEMGEALSRGEMLKLQPLGTVRVQRQKPADNGETLVLKMRRKKPSPAPKDPLAEAAE